MEIDLAVLLPSIIALCALFTPIINTFLNNRHLRKLKELELEHQSFKLVTLHKRELFENYLALVGEFSYEETKIPLSELTKAYYLILPYIPQDKAESFRSFTDNIAKTDFHNDKDNELGRILHSLIIPTIKEEIEKV